MQDDFTPDSAYLCGQRFTVAVIHPLVALDSPDWPRIFSVGAARAEAHF
jgi:hypothetical protein